MTRRWRALVVDDEPPARALVASHVREHPSLELVSECADGHEAVRDIRALRPDVVFLDIQMPGLSGFQVIEEIGVEDMPLVVFVTAYDEHALRAFRTHAFDYLLKPLDTEQWTSTADRVAERLAANAGVTMHREATDASSHEQLGRLLAALERQHEGEDRLTIWDNGRAVIVRAADIDRVETDGNYVRLYAGSARHLMRETMSGIERRLSSSQFVRLNRSVIVNIDRIREIQTYFRGDFAVILTDGTTVISGRTYRERLHRRFRSSESPR